MKQEKKAIQCGVDEAGRGCLAGPVVAAAVILPKHFNTRGIADSKALSAVEREQAFERITAEAVYAVGMVDAGEIDRLNILQATMKAMHIALRSIHEQYAFRKYAPHKPDVLLIDGNYFRSTEFDNWQTIIKGDVHEPCISAASIVAKVTRDRWMHTVAHQEFPHYGFDRHKGYGTKQHREAILHYGASVLHRRSFLSNLLAKAGEQGILYETLKTT